MEINKLDRFHRQLRQNVRSFLLVATMDELKKEEQISLDRGDLFRAECVQELIAEKEAEEK